MGNGTELGRVRGLGRAHEGAHHWWNQRLTAGSNLFLMLWFVIAVAQLPGYDYPTVSAWARSAWVAIPLLLLVATVFWHFRLGLQAVIEDYQAGESRIVAMVLLNFFTVVVTVIALFAILKIAFSAGAAH